MKESKNNGLMRVCENLLVRQSHAPSYAWTEGRCSSETFLSSEAVPEPTAKKLASQAEVLQLIEGKDLPGARGPIDQRGRQTGIHGPVNDF